MKAIFTLLFLSSTIFHDLYAQKVLIIWDDSPTNVHTVVLKDSLIAAGYDITMSSVSETAWNNTNPSIAGFEVVIHLNGTTFNTGMPQAGQTALVDFVQNKGGRYIGFEWNAYEVDEALTMTTMEDLVLFNRNSTGSEVVRKHDVIPSRKGHPIMKNVASTFNVNGALEIGGLRVFTNRPSTALMTHNGSDAVAFRHFGNGLVLGFAVAPNWNSNSNALASTEIHKIIMNFINFSCVPSSSTFLTSACDSFTWINGITYTSSNNTATYRLNNSLGCDSVVTLNLTISTIADKTTTANHNTITANTNDATYQWLDCDNGFAIIPGETGKSFVATKNGNYAVELNNKGCKMTSDCVNLNAVGVMDIENNLPVSVYPNPSSGMVQVSFEEPISHMELTLTDIQGKVISRSEYSNISATNLELIGANGVYFLTIKTAEGEKTIKVIKE